MCEEMAAAIPARGNTCLSFRLWRHRRLFEPGLQVVMCASVRDTAEYWEEVTAKVAQVRTLTRNRILWVSETVPRDALIAICSQAALFVCPSIYEPFGIINLEAMACGTPVVASAAGGIREVVEDGLTGRLVPFEPVSRDNPEPKDTEVFAKNLAQAVNSVLAAPSKLQTMAGAARNRMEDHFTWRVVARKTLEFYKKLISQA